MGACLVLNINLKTLLLNAIYMAIYIAFCFIFAPFSFGEIQIRISEALCILPIYDKLSVVSITIACAISNFMNGNIIDAIFGSLATFIGLVLTYCLRKKNFYIAVFPTVVSNAIIIPFVLKYGYGLYAFPIYINMVFVFIGELLSVYIFGTVIKKILEKYIYKK